MALTALGTVKYNKITFDETTVTSLRVTPVYDSAGRTVVYNVFAFTFRTIVQDSGGTDARVQRMRRALTKPGMPFTYEGQGLGELSLNVVAAANAPSDVVWGPKPRELTLRPLGQGNACELVWQLEVAIPDCTDAEFAFAPMEFCYRVEHEIDRAGSTTRTITGHLRVPNNRAPGANTPLDSADFYRERIDPPRLTGFRRTYPTPFVVSEDRSRLDFAIRDEELGEEPYPVGVVDLRLSHSVSSTSRGLTSWTGQFESEYELARGVSPKIAAVHFLAVVRGRLGFTAGALLAAGNAVSILPLSFVARDPDVYGRNPKAGFSLSYTFARTVENVLEASGLWQRTKTGGLGRLGDSTAQQWRQWEASLDGTAFHVRGEARLTFSPGDDSLVDLCKPGARLPGDGRAPGFALGLPPDLRLPPVGGQVAPGEQFVALVQEAFPPPSPEKSWLAYENEIWCEVDNHAVPVVPLPSAKQAKRLKDAKFAPFNPFEPLIKVVDSTEPFLKAAVPGAVDLLDVFGFDLDPAGRLHSFAPSGTVDQNAAGRARTAGINFGQTLGQAAGKALSKGLSAVQTRANPTIAVFLRGRAARAGFRIPIPTLKDVNGVPAVPANRMDRGEGFGQGVRFAGATTEVFTAEWNLRYLVHGIPEMPLPVPPNPLLEPDASQAFPLLPDAPPPPKKPQGRIA